MPERAPRVVVLDDGYPDYDTERRVLAPFGAELTVAPCRGDPARVLAVAASADAILVRETPLPGHVIDGLTGCRVIVRYGVGVDNIDRSRAAARRIFVANVPDYGVDEVSDHALALLLAVRRRLPERDGHVRAGRWGVQPGAPIRRTRGQTLGLIGCGRIGERFLHKAMALGFAHALVVSRGPVPDAAIAVDLDTLCAEADVISLHLPLTPETYRILDARRVAAMRPGAVVINTARGGLIDEAALADALACGHLGGAGLDVFEHEPPAPDSPLLQAPNCVLSDHFAWYSAEAEGDLQRLAAEEVARVFRGERPRHWVNPW